MTDKSVEQIEAREAIRQQLFNYIRSMDRLDHELGYAVWHDDGTADYGSQIFQGTGCGFVDWTCAALLKRTATSHQITTVGITVSGDRAVSEAYVTARCRNRLGKSKTETVYIGRYLDRWSLRESRWAIDHRIFVLDFDDERPVVEVLGGWGTRDASDPSHELMQKGVTSGHHQGR